ncbi:uncharacterized protein LOC119363137 isoform X3 [Triticum dicoccoides]|uniref:uncharacterized protein LOC119363137 isoform X3 n=2 Tax=Triticum dicoccoides TaxID=85692 RepID=UPI00188FC531|nr:uncharacterized protein LOC119363137 isoform X3 [Triticum dicoccoides]
MYPFVAIWNLARDLQSVILKTAVPVMAMVLLLTASTVSVAPDDCACAYLRACFGSNYLLMVGVLCQINLARLLAKEAVLAPTLAARRYYAVGAVACFMELALKLYMILVLCPSA